MSIQRRFLLALALLLVASVVVLSLVVMTYTAPRVVAWENARAAAEVQRVRQALERESEHLGIYAREWAVWDDTYEFMHAPSPAYVEANLGYASFVAASVDLLAYVRDDGGIVWAGLKTGADVDAAAGTALVRELRSPSMAALGHNDGINGILDTDLGLMVIAVHAVRDSQEEKPVRGLMIAGRVLDRAYVQRLRDQTELDLDLAPLSDLARLTGPMEGTLELPTDGTPRIRALTPAQLQLLAVLPDMAGLFTLALRVNLSRAVFMQGRELLKYTLLGTLALFMLTLAAAHLLLRRMVFTPIAELARHVFELQNSGDYGRRLNNQRHDEIGKLAREFDALLEQIDDQARALRRLSFEDALTGLRNRRSFDEQLRSAWALLQRTGQPLSLMVLDVDDFKRYNDHYGHPQGDEALRAVAQAVRQVLRRAGDTIARYGGEEFAAIMPGTSRGDAIALAERVRQAVEDLGLPHVTSEVSGVVTVTIGIASITPQQGMSEEVVLRLADEALYSAKRDGKNRVHLAADLDTGLSAAAQTR